MKIQKNILLIFIVIITVFLFLYSRYDILDIDYKTILLEKYLINKNYIDNHQLLFAFIYFVFSIFWIFFLGIVSPILILGIMMFGYYGYVLSLISFTIGGTFSFLVARKFKYLVKSVVRKIDVKENSFFLFIVFRFTPGVPFMIKNFSGIFFNLNLKKFILATLIAETPQLLLFTFIIMSLLESSKFLIDEFDSSVLLEILFFPLLLLFLFVIFLFFLKKRFGGKIFKI